MRIKKVLLINPASQVKSSWIEGLQSFPLGLASIASVLSDQGFDVEILDCFIEDYSHREEIDTDYVRIGMSNEDICRAIKKSAPDLVGISVQFTIQLHMANQVASLVKKVDSKIITVAGGNHACADPKTITGRSFDWLIFGEGEFRLPQLIQAINLNTLDILGPDIIAISENIHFKSKNFHFGVIPNLETLPIPRYDLLPLEKYWAMAKGERFANIFMTRGCPFKCVFCSIHIIMGHQMRYKNIVQVIQEIKYLCHDLNVQVIYIEDDNLTFDMEWAKELFTAIANEHFGVKFHIRNGIRADMVDLELLRLMKKAGVIKVGFAPESGSQKTLDNIIKKHFKLEDCEKAIKLTNKVGIYISCFLVIGFPEETMEDIQKTIDYAFYLKKIGSDNVWISCATPYPGTELFENCIAKGILSEENIPYEDFATMGSVIHNQWFTEKELKKIRDEAMLKLTSNRKLQVLKSALSNPLLFFVKARNIVLRRIRL